MARFRDAALLIAISAAASGRAAWAGPQADVQPKVLNNLVTQLLKVENLPPGSEAAYPFANPRAGWVFIGLRGKAETDLQLDGKPAGLPAAAGAAMEGMEGMRLLSAGEHRLRIKAPAGADVEILVVRAVPELAYSRADAGPQVAEYGSFDLPWLRRHVLPHLNCVLVGGSADEAFLGHLKKAGLRVLEEIHARPFLDQTEEWTARKAFDYWATSAGMTRPQLSGIVGDEFFRSDEKNAERYRMVIESVRMIHRDPRFKDRVFYPYITTLYGGQISEEFLRTMVDCGYRCPWERYLFEKSTIEEARKYLQEKLVDEARAYEKAVPGIIRHLTVCFGHLISAPPESVNSHPAVDQKYTMDMQFNIIANDPAFKGLWGVMEYLTAYADEEYLRWAMRLYRHYGIEGNTEMLAGRYGYEFAPGHLTNPDFDEGLKGWTCRPAEDGSIGAGSFPGYSWLQGRYPKTRQGDTFLLTRRSARGPNLFSQEIRKLKPGRLYCVKMFTGDHGDLAAEKSNRQVHVVSMKIENVDPVAGKSFQHVFANCYSHHAGKFNDTHKYWMNYHVQVFRAKGPGAQLVVSDWAREKPAGPIGQKLMFNFFELQPYFEE